MAVRLDWTEQSAGSCRQSEVTVWDMRDAIPCWRLPALFVQGRDGSCGFEGRPAAAALMPCAEIAWLEDCAHIAHVEQSECALALPQFVVAKAVTDEQ